jgi:hypothetical protein
MLEWFEIHWFELLVLLFLAHIAYSIGQVNERLSSYARESAEALRQTRLQFDQKLDRVRDPLGAIVNLLDILRKQGEPLD